MDAVKFIKERVRMCKSNEYCRGCEFYDFKVKADMECATYINIYPEETVAVVEKWSQEHPQKTMLQDLLEKHPKVMLRDDSTPKCVCPEDLGYCEGRYCNEINKLDCVACWNRPLEEQLWTVN